MRFSERVTVLISRSEAAVGGGMRCPSGSLSLIRDCCSVTLLEQQLQKSATAAVVLRSSLSLYSWCLQHGSICLSPDFTPWI
uniref:Uncharacterized protein n=1 Tax=Physcomitrium patens TaxID=3218 RepID=A0A2K1JPZ0_PHYPA|nr:hypothetical protein PHYPA_015984 [Physcomitrium patens]